MSESESEDSEPETIVRPPSAFLFDNQVYLAEEATLAGQLYLFHDVHEEAFLPSSRRRQGRIKRRKERKENASLSMSEAFMTGTEREDDQVNEEVDLRSTDTAFPCTAPQLLAALSQAAKADYRDRQLYLQHQRALHLLRSQQTQLQVNSQLQEADESGEVLVDSDALFETFCKLSSSASSSSSSSSSEDDCEATEDEKESFDSGLIAPVPTRPRASLVIDRSTSLSPVLQQSNTLNSNSSLSNGYYPIFPPPPQNISSSVNGGMRPGTPFTTSSSNTAMLHGNNNAFLTAAFDHYYLHLEMDATGINVILPALPEEPIANGSLSRQPNFPHPKKPHNSNNAAMDLVEGFGMSENESSFFGMPFDDEDDFWSMSQGLFEETGVEANTTGASSSKLPSN